MNSDPLILPQIDLADNSQILRAPENKLCLIEAGEPISISLIRRQAARFRDWIARHHCTRLALIDASASTQIAAMEACWQSHSDLLLLRHKQDDLESFLDLHPIHAILDVNENAIRRFSNEVLPASGALFLTSSGTTGFPKIIPHNLSELLNKAPSPRPSNENWLLTYHPASFAGLQVLLTGLRNQVPVIAPGTQDFNSLTESLFAHRPTHISGTPTFWRWVMMAKPPRNLACAIRQITLGGELVDQNTLDLLTKHFPKARIIHIYATTELGVLFTVRDGKAGFPAQWLEEGVPKAHLRIVNGELEVARKSVSTKLNAWHRTGDLVRQSGDRVYFEGRADFLINVGGAKVVPDEVESTMREHPAVAEIQVMGRANPVLGTIVSARVVLKKSPTNPDAQKEALRCFAAERLASHKIPRMIEFVDHIQTNATGKKRRLL